VRLVDAAPGAPDLLVVRDRRRRRLVVDDEPEVRLVVAHAERRGRHDRLDVVGQQPPLGLHPLLVGDLARVGDRADALSPEPLRDRLGVALGQAVDDPGPRELWQPRREPRQPRGRLGQDGDLEPQAAPRQRAAVDDELVGPRRARP
jgi:hypothetical protein